MICEQCGRDNADNLTFCQDCGRRLRPPRVVSPTPPSGISKAPALLPQPSPLRAQRDEPTPTQEDEVHMVSLTELVADPMEPESAGHRPTTPAPEASICTSCSTPNPPGYRFCVTCGAALKKRESAPDRSTDKPLSMGGPVPPAASAPLRVSPEPAAKPSSPRLIAPTPPQAPPPKPSAPRASPSFGSSEPYAGEKIVGAPVVEIASGSTPARLITCPRCHGHCVAGTRFCKYCGAPLDEARAREDAPKPVSPEDLDWGLRERRDEPPAMGAPAPKPTPGHGGSSDGVRDDVSILAGSPVPDMPVLIGGRREPPGVANAPRTVTAESPRNPALAQRMAPELTRPVPAPPVAQAQGGARGQAIAQQKPARIVVIVEDGSEGKSFPLAGGQVDIGRNEGDILLEDDLYVSPRHARLHREGGAWFVRDLGSTNHVYVRLRRPQPLRDGDLLLLGLEVLQFQTVSDGERGLGHAMQHGTLLFGSPATPRRARLTQRTVEGIVRDVYHVFRDETVIGRETGDIVFTSDPFLSRRHAMIKRNPATSEFTLVDLDSSNGTYVAITGEVPLSHGDFLRIGQHLFRVDLG